MDASRCSPGQNRPIDRNNGKVIVVTDYRLVPITIERACTSLSTTAAGGNASPWKWSNVKTSRYSSFVIFFKQYFFYLFFSHLSVGACECVCALCSLHALYASNSMSRLAWSWTRSHGPESHSRWRIVWHHPLTQLPEERDRSGIANVCTHCAQPTPNDK